MEYNVLYKKMYYIIYNIYVYQDIDVCFSVCLKTEVHRDRLMDQLDREHPLYGFKRHKGYGTEGHLEAIRRHGICKEHRKSFAPIRELLESVKGSLSICKALKGAI